jgi:hypothetical protein
MNIAAAAIAIVGVLLAVFALGPSTVCSGDPGVCVVQPAAAYRLWTIVGSLVLALGLVVADAILLPDD